MPNSVSTARMSNSSRMLLLTNLWPHLLHLRRCFVAILLFFLLPFPFPTLEPHWGQAKSRKSSRSRFVTPVEEPPKGPDNERQPKGVESHCRDPERLFHFRVLVHYGCWLVSGPRNSPYSDNPRQFITDAQNSYLLSFLQQCVL